MKGDFGPQPESGLIPTCRCRYFLTPCTPWWRTGEPVITGADVIRFQLDRPTPLLNTTLRLHWRARSRESRLLAGHVRLATHGQRPPEPWPRARVRIERRSLGVPDHDGMVGGCKALIDTLVAPGAPYAVTRNGRSRWTSPHPYGLGIIRDDNPDCLVLEAVAVRVAKRAEQCTLVEVVKL